MPLKFHNRDIISMNTLSKDEIEHILTVSKELKNTPKSNILNGSIMASCFFEPSTRTRLSFETAMHRMGGNVVGFSDSQTTSTSKGERLSDTIKTIGQYVDVIVIRHPLDGSAQIAAESTDKPVINGGDGTNQHPTQTLTDLFTILETQGTLENLRIAVVGDLKHGRTVHSLAQAFAYFNPRLYFVSPQGLEMPQHICHDLKKMSIKFSIHGSIKEIIDKVDILYMTRIQEERFADKLDYQRLKDSYVLTPEILKLSNNDNLRVLHPFPRVNEISREVDHSPQAYYFQQAQNGIFVRQALLALTLGKL